METVDAQCDYIFKVVLVGDSNVGKTSLLQRFRHGTFSANLRATIGADFTVKTLTVDGKSVKLQIWDTAGQEQYSPITRISYHHSKAIILCYDLTKRASFDKVSDWLHEIRRFAPEDVVLLLVATKADLEPNRQVSTSDGAEQAAAQGLHAFMETSSVHDSNVTETFISLATELKRGCDCKLESDPGSPSIRLSASTAVDQGSQWGYCGNCGWR